MCVRYIDRGRGRGVRKKERGRKFGGVTNIDLLKFLDFLPTHDDFSEEKCIGLKLMIRETKQRHPL